MSPAAVCVDAFSSLRWWGSGSDGVLGETLSGEPLVPARETIMVATDALQTLLLGESTPNPGHPGHHTGKARGSGSLSQRTSHPQVATARASLGLCGASRDGPPWHGTALVGVLGSLE